jgi:hypothetical protein
MANTVKVKRSATPSKVPTTTDLQLGEIAVNTYDGKMYIKKDNGTASVVEIGGTAGSGDVVGPSSATDNAVARFDTTTGKLIQNSVVTVSDTGAVTGVIEENFTPVTPPTYLEGKVFYDTDAKTLAYYNDNSQMTVNIGQEQIVRVRNQTGATISDGTVVYVNGATGNTPTIAKAIATSFATSDIIGVTTTSIANNGFGYVTINGLVNGLNTSAFAEGNAVFLSATTAGTYTTTEPTRPNYSIQVGIILRANPSNGTLLVSTQFISTEAQHIIGTLAVNQGGTGQTSYTDGQLLIGNTTGNTLTKSTLTAGTGISVTNGAGSITIANTGVTSVTGTSPIASSGGTTPAISISQATTSTNGYLSSTDWNTFNNKTSNTGTVTSVSGTGTVNGLTLTGTVTTSGNLTLGGTLSGVSLTSQVSGTLPVANGGTGLTSLTAGYIPFGAGTSAFGNSANLFWDNTNARLGIGTNSPATQFVVSNGGAGGIEIIPTGTIQSYNRSTSAYQNMNLDAASFLFRPAGTERMRISASGGVSVGTTVDAGTGNLLVNGTVTAGGQLAVNNTVYFNAGTGPSDFNDLNLGGVGGWSANESHGINTYYGSIASPTVFTRVDSQYAGISAVMRWKNFYYNGAQTSTVMSLTSASASTANLNVTGSITGASFSGAGTGLTGTAASLSIGGNAATATNLSTTGANWSTNGTISAVVGQLAWKNYGNSHVIFDASAGTAPNGTAVNNTNSQVAWGGTYPTLMGWNGANTYGVRVDSARLADTATNQSGGTVSATTINGSTYVTTSGPYFRNAAGKGYLDGQYASVETIATSGAIYSIGGAYVPGSTTLGNMYGIGYTYSQTAGNPGGVPSNTWGMYVASNGTARVFLDSDNGRGYFAGSVTASSFSGAGTNLTGTATSLSIGGNAATATSSPLLSALGNYVWSASTLPVSYNQGIQCSFVQSANGFPSYGSVMTMNTYSGGGGALQMFVPYSPTYGGTGLQVRFGNYDASNAWTSWKTLLASDNYTSYTGTFVPNTFTSYGNTATNVTKNGYYGLLFGTATTNMNFMFDTGGSGGMYRESSGWATYWFAAHNCLGVNGSATSASYALYVTGSAYSTGNFVAASDVRIKENIVTVDNALEKTLALRGVYYNKIDDETKTRQIGVIAQEVQEVIPEAVTYAEDVDQYGVEYGKLAGLFIEAIKELNNEVKSLKAEIAQLKSKG